MRGKLKENIVYIIECFLLSLEDQVVCNQMRQGVVIMCVVKLINKTVTKVILFLIKSS